MPSRSISRRFGWRATTIATITSAALVLTACGGSGSEEVSSKPSVVVGFYPQQYLAEKIGGDTVSVTSLAKEGQEPHDMELSAQNVADISAADLVIYQEGMQPAVDDAVANEEPAAALDLLTTVETIDGEADTHGHGAEGEEAPAEGSTSDEHAHEGEHEHEGEPHAKESGATPEESGAPAEESGSHSEEGHDHEGEEGHDHEGHDHEGEDPHHHEGEVDPHIWLDPANMIAMGEAIAAELAEVDPDNASAYEENLAALKTELTGLDEDFTAGLAQCEGKDIVTTHTAFGYLANAYGLSQVGITGLVPEENPSPEQIIAAQEFAAEHGVTTIFYEQDGDPGYAETVAGEIGATTAVLSPLEVGPSSGDYVSTMQENLATLKTALSCA